MKHFQDLTVAVANVETNKATLKFDIDKGLITWAGIFFPPGCHNVVYGKIFFQEHQILPRGQESWCHGDAGWWDAMMYFPVTAKPLEIKAVAYNVDACYEHELQIGLELMPFTMVPQWDKLIEFLKSVGAETGLWLTEEQITEMTME